MIKQKISKYIKKIENRHSNLPFDAVKLRDREVKAAWKKAKAKHNLNTLKIKMPKIEAYVVDVEAFEKIKREYEPDADVSILGIYFHIDLSGPERAVIYLRTGEREKESFELECEKLLDICTSEELVVSKIGQTPQEQMKDAKRILDEEPETWLLYIVGKKDAKMYRVLQIPSKYFKAAKTKQKSVEA